MLSERTIYDLDEIKALLPTIQQLPCKSKKRTRTGEHIVGDPTFSVLKIYDIEPFEDVEIDGKLLQNINTILLYLFPRDVYVIAKAFPCISSIMVRGSPLVQYLENFLVVHNIFNMNIKCISGDVMVVLKHIFRNECQSSQVTDDELQSFLKKIPATLFLQELDVLDKTRTFYSDFSFDIFTVDFFMRCLAALLDTEATHEFHARFMKFWKIARVLPYNRSWIGATENCHRRQLADALYHYFFVKCRQEESIMDLLDRPVLDESCKFNAALWFSWEYGTHNFSPIPNEIRRLCDRAMINLWRISKSHHFPVRRAQAMIDLRALQKECKEVPIGGAEWARALSCLTVTCQKFLPPLPKDPYKD